ncbi:TniB family NTP-binding protein [Pseudomonas sp. B15(2017)]|jgi:GTPase SAR1 family protein|uniref:TniB family NTP-binding protein n=1 Tax=Pseudomonas sp. B15(2017) TaxID=1981744 RepID=UPI000A1E4791|nr:TniB family NTP-binding protein [Pseudomonas sp. B15(2017)]
MDGSHLREDRRRLLSEDIDTRIKALQQDVWVDYKPSETVFRMMNNMVHAPVRHTAPALLVIGPGGSGKSAIISQIPHRVENSKGLIFIDMAEDPHISAQKNLRFELAAALGVPAYGKSKTSMKEDVPNELGEVIRLRGIWGLVIDELQDLLLRSRQEQRINMSILKKLLGPAYGLAIFGFGTVTARRALSSNDEFKRRFFEVSLEDWRESEDFRSFLLEVEELLPLKAPSHLYSAEMVKNILAITSGRMDKIIELLRSAACYAIKQNQEVIDINCLQCAAKSPWGY